MTHSGCHPSATDLADGDEPAWDVAKLFPPQGGWAEDDFLRLPGNHLAEFDHGRIEVLRMPSELHQLLVAFLYRALADHVAASALGVVLFAPFPIKLWEGKLREPDIVFMRREHADRRQGKFWRGADLVMEVISPDDRGRDRITKRREYALAGIPEYWLIDTEARTVIVLVRAEQADSYLQHGEFVVGQTASSATLPGFSIDVQALFGCSQ
jgi:Uma2 family endonuclease